MKKLITTIGTIFICNFLFSQSVPINKIFDTLICKDNRSLFYKTLFVANSYDSFFSYQNVDNLCFKLDYYRNEHELLKLLKKKKNKNKVSKVLYFKRISENIKDSLVTYSFIFGETKYKIYKRSAIIFFQDEVTIIFNYDSLENRWKISKIIYTYK